MLNRKKIERVTLYALTSSTTISIVWLATTFSKVRVPAVQLMLLYTIQSGNPADISSPSTIKWKLKGATENAIVALTVELYNIFDIISGSNATPSG